MKFHILTRLFGFSPPQQICAVHLTDFITSCSSAECLVDASACGSGSNDDMRWLYAICIGVWGGVELCLFMQEGFVVLARIHGDWA
jgi:hypothetical protein